MDRKTALRMRLRQIIKENAGGSGTLSSRSAVPKSRRLSLKAILEDANPDLIEPDRFPMTLSAAASDPQMKDKVTKGTEDKKSEDDTVGVSSVNIAVSELKPSQSTMKVSNAVGMAIGMLVKGQPGGDLGAFISSDNYIMDGHHRWIATYMVDPSATVGGKQVNLPGKQLVAVLNAITAGKFGNAGNPGKGSFADFQDKAKIKAEIDNVVQNGVPKFTTPEDAKKAVDEKGGSDALADLFVKNLSSATLSTPGWAVERIEMPVINPGGNASEAEKALTGGEVDLNPPYYGGEGGEETKKESRYRSGHVVVERWQKLAGILKG